LTHSWGFSSIIIKSHAEEKARDPRLEELLEIWRFPFNICTMAEANDFKFGTQLGFAKAHHKITPVGKKWPWPWGRGAPKNCGVPL